MLCSRHPNPTLTPNPDPDPDPNPDQVRKLSKRAHYEGDQYFWEHLEAPPLLG